MRDNCRSGGNASLTSCSAHGRTRAMICSAQRNYTVAALRSNLAVFKLYPWEALY